jgi:hypothetical protein
MNFYKNLDRLLLSLIICLFFTCNTISQELMPSDYVIGEIDYLDYYVSPTGNDDNNGRSLNSAFRSLTQAYNSIPKDTSLSEAIRINIASGAYPENRLPNFWENIIGNVNHPVLIRAISGPNTVTLQGDINALNLRYVYFQDLNIVPAPAGDAFHCEACNHILLKRMTLNGGATDGSGAHETLKVNQSKYFYIEDSDISGADDNAIDFVAVQYGHVIRTVIHRAHDWCFYAKGGSAQMTIAGNLIYNCGTGGFTAGQGTGFEFMESPWLHYEAYDIKFVNNIIKNTEGAGIGVNGGYNVLLAHNTLYRVGSRSHLIEVYRGRRGCDGNGERCSSLASAGGWGGNVAEEQVIPNKNIFIYNNIAYNPSDYTVGTQHFDIHPPQSSVGGFSNISFPAKADENLQIKGNLIWSGTSEQALGIEDSDACTNSNLTCNEAQLRADNTINSTEPEFSNVNENDFRPAINSNILTVTGFSISNFAGSDQPNNPAVPAGNLINLVSKDRGSSNRSSTVVGAYLSINSALGSIGPEGDGETNNPGNSSPVISSVTGQIKKIANNTKKVSVLIRTQASDPDGDLSSVKARIQSTRGGPVKVISLRGSGLYTGKTQMKKAKKYNINITAVDQNNNSTESTGRTRR